MDLNIPKITTRLWIWFLGIMCTVPLFSHLLKFTQEGERQIQPAIFSLVALPPLLIAAIAYFYIQTVSLKKSLRAVSGSGSGKEKILINGYPFRVSMLIGITNIAIPTIAQIIGLLKGFVFSWEQSFFFWISDLATAVISSTVFYYFAKKEIYPIIKYTDYEPIRLYHKILIPTMSSIMVLILMSTAGIYKIGVTRNEDFMRQIMSLNLEEAALYLNTTLEKLLLQVDSYAKSETVRDMNLQRIREYLKDLQEDKEPFVKSFFVSNMEGETVNSLGFKFNVKAGKIFQSIKKNSKFAFSNPVKSADDNSDIVVCAVPILLKKDLIGNFGMTFAIETIGQALLNASDHGKYDFIMFSDEGTVIFHKNYANLNKNFKKDFSGENYSGFENLIGENFEGTDRYNRQFHDIVFEGVKMKGMTVPLPKFNSRLLILIPKKEFYVKLNITLLQISFFIILFTVFLTLIIRGITNNFTVPIRDTIQIFEKISKGDLSVRPKDFVPDEFGEIIRYLHSLLNVLRDTVSVIQSSSEKLESTSEILSRTTVSMASTTQKQSKSLNESAQFLQEISGSVEKVAENSKLAFHSSKHTFSSMEDLLIKVKEVQEHSHQAKAIAMVSSKEAQKGNELMKNAIRGMENIDSSTKKIAEIVGLISDISKQVNLLALNAAIEAARAGDFGRGFTVVADEISKLASKTSSSAKSIREYIEEGLQEVAYGKEYVDQTAKALSHIIESIEKNNSIIEMITEASRIQTESSEAVLTDVKEVMEMAESIHRATDVQAKSSQELTSNVSHVADLTDFVAKGADEVADTSQKILEQTKSLNDQVDFFKI